MKYSKKSLNYRIIKCELYGMWIISNKTDDLKTNKQTNDSFFTIWRYNKKATVCKPGKDLSPEPMLASDSPASRTVRNKCLLFKPPSLCISL